MSIAGCGGGHASTAGDEAKQYEGHGWGKEEAEGAVQAGRSVEAEEAADAEEEHQHQREREDLPAVEAEEAREEGG